LVWELKSYIYAGVGSLVLFAFTGGSNFLASFFLDIPSYSVFSEIHMRALYLSAILCLAISYCAPRIVTSEVQGVKSKDLLYSLVFYSTLIFFLLSVLLIEILQLYINEGRLIIYIILSLSLYFSFCQNIYGILLASKRYIDSTIFLSIVVIIYITVVLKFTVTGVINLDAWLIGIISCFLVAITCATAIRGLYLVSYKRIAMFTRSSAMLDILLPSLISGMVLGAALLLLYKSFVDNSEMVQIAFLGYALVLKNAGQFLSNVVNKVIFIKLSHEFGIGQFGLKKDFVVRTFLRNVVTVIVAVVAISVCYLLFYDNYFLKYEEFPRISYLILVVWALIEIFYFVLYQGIQVNGLMWHSLFFICIPSLIYSIIISLFFTPTDIIDVLIVYCGFTCVSVAGVIFILASVKPALMSDSSG
jgi:hypothetical protein